jgi:hypothetical protein
MLKDVEESREFGIVSWLPHGRAFLVHYVDEFVSKIDYSRDISNIASGTPFVGSSVCTVSEESL